MLPRVGNLSATTRPLIQVWPWPRDAHGTGRCRSISFRRSTASPSPCTIPRSATRKPTRQGRARGAGVRGAAAGLRNVPAGMALDPRTIGLRERSICGGASAYERDLQARFLTPSPTYRRRRSDFTLKNQLFFDGSSSSKSPISLLPSDQEVFVLRTRLTLTRRLAGLPSWLHVTPWGR